MAETGLSAAGYGRESAWALGQVCAGEVSQLATRQPGSPQTQHKWNRNGEARRPL